MKQFLVMPFLVVIFSFCHSSAQEIQSYEELNEITKEIHTVVSKKRLGVTDKLPIIVAIGGCPGVGKSTIAKMFQDELLKLGIKSAIISLDHWGLSQEARKAFANELDPRRIEWEKLHDTLIDIRNGKLEIVKPTINQLTKERGEESLYLEEIGCILFEGSYALTNFSPMDFLQYSDINIYLEASLESIYSWKWERELKKAIPRSPEEFYCHMQAILNDFAFHVYPSRRNADFIIQINPLHHYCVMRNVIKENPQPEFTEFRLQRLSY